MHDGVTSIPQRPLQRILGEISNQQFEISTKIVEEEAKRNSLREKERKVREMLFRIQQPHSYLRSNNERLGISEAQEYQASHFNPRHAEPSYDYAAPFVAAGEPLAIAYTSLQTIAQQVAPNDPTMINFIHLATQGCEHIFRRMTCRTLDEESYKYATYIIEDTTRAVQATNEPDLSIPPLLPSIREYLIGRNLLADLNSHQD
jgi:hypothetical protein